MDEFLEVIETIRAEEASNERIFKGEGMGVRKMNLRRGPNYQKKLAEAAKFMANVIKGRVPSYRFQEAMTTSDFPYLFGDILDRQVLAAYAETPSTWSLIAKRSVVRDFREVKRFSTYGADDVLATVAEQKEYPIGKINENAPYVFAVKKHGRRLPFSFETFVNDDLEALTDSTQRLGRAARRSESKFVTTLYVDANGPHASLYTVGNGNIITGNPVLSVASLQAALEQLAGQTDENGEPIFIEMVELRVGPALEITALNILNALQLELTERGGTANEKLITANWLKSKVRVSVDHYIPIVASTANGNTSWFLFANPDNGRPALEIGFLRGHEEPEIFMKQPNAVRVGGGGADEFDFDTDSREYKVRHIFGGTRMDPKMTVGSQGDGS
jgi:hypothetical protein